LYWKIYWAKIFGIERQRQTFAQLWIHCDNIRVENLHFYNSSPSYNPSEKGLGGQ
jgi:hypothetical protein